MGAKYCDQRVCLSVCLFIRSHISKPHVQISPRGSVLLWRQCDSMYFRFCEWRHVFNSHNRANGQYQATRVFRRVRQVAGPGAKSAVSDCVLLNQKHNENRQVDVMTRNGCARIVGHCAFPPAAWLVGRHVRTVEGCSRSSGRWVVASAQSAGLPAAAAAAALCLYWLFGCYTWSLGGVMSDP